MSSKAASILQRIKINTISRQAAHDKQEIESVLRSELFNAEQMEVHAKELAAIHQTKTQSGPDILLIRFNDNDKKIDECCKLFSEINAAPQQKKNIQPAALWLLDNYWLIEEQIRTARRHIPEDYSKSLPKLAHGTSSDLPRVYDIALEIISHGDGQFDRHILERFVVAYQEVTPLTLGELWAIPIMLRIALIENIRRVATRVVATWHDINLAVGWSDYLISIAENDRKNVLLAVALMVKSTPPTSSAFVAELFRRLQGQGAALSLPINWFEELLAESNMNIDKLVQLDAQQQAAEQVSISNSIGSLRILSAIDWREFVESVSIVEQILYQDPAGIYGKMDFSTRDHYRHAVERLAKRYNLSEQYVAQTLLDLANKDLNKDMDKGQRRQLSLHVGYYLIDDGLAVLKWVLSKPGMDEKDKAKDKRYLRFKLRERASLSGYLLLTLVFMIIMAWPFILVLKNNHFSFVWLVLLAIPIAFVVSQFALKLVNWLVTALIPPRFIPRLDYKEGIEEGSRTMVVIPTIIASEKDIDQLIQKLEVHYLSNPGPNIQFGMLTDFADHLEEHADSDEHLLQLARQGVEALNLKYPNTFFLCHRPRQWNENEGKWMGFERKRGKICDFNALLRGVGKEKFTLLLGSPIVTLAYSKPVRYVVTLDTDTQMPRDTVRKLVGAMSHPINCPYYDTAKKRVTAGYAIMQPRLGITLPSSNKSLYVRMFTTEAGTDPYTRNISDVYQDLFQQGSYIGKGIYEVDTFEKAIQDRFADNRILSHDLIEGCYARSGLISDVILYDDYPASFSADVKRRYRWVRGDWQLLPWVFPWVKTRNNKIEHNPLSALSRWKIVDNLRRSFFPLSLLAMFIIGWFISGQSLLWTLGLTGMMLLEPLISALQSVFHKPQDVSCNHHVKSILSTLGRQALNMVVVLAWLPFEALYNTDAALRTLWRVFISKHHLLEWEPSGSAERNSAKNLLQYCRLMFVAPLVSIGVAICMVISETSLIIALPLLVLWFICPGVAWFVSRVRRDKLYEPNASERRFLRILARKTWAFFEQYVGPNENWLPPDNLQERPYLVVAHRTSPTNMGLSLLAHMAALDFGYISNHNLLERLAKSLNVMSGLERYRNHFFNWYDTQTLEPLNPRYISTVDSGNLAGHLMVLRQALLELENTKIFDEKYFAAIEDSACIVEDLLTPTDKKNTDWRIFQETLAAAKMKSITSLQQGCELIEKVTVSAKSAYKSHGHDVNSELTFWFNALVAQCLDLTQDLKRLMLPSSNFDETLNLPTLNQLANINILELPECIRKDALCVKNTARARIDELKRLASLCENMSIMDFGFLYDEQRNLLSIGYQVNGNKVDASYYDLLASEARLAYFIAIAQGQLPQESWFALGRMLTGKMDTTVLVSWSGSMFEYLMPMLVMPSYEGSLLDETSKGIVKMQIDYGKELGLPWGISESGYNIRDINYNYQYRAFGVPGTGLMSGLGEDVVLAPYATALALMVNPLAAIKNMEELSSMGLNERFGFYEAVDCTSIRLPRGQDFAIIYSFMAHHQAMSFLSLASLLLHQPMQQRFLNDPALRATKLLLEEKMPETISDHLHNYRYLARNSSDPDTDVFEEKARITRNPNLAQPMVQLLSNGNYHLMISNAGGGYSRYQDLSITRWREDSTRDSYGMFHYVRDMASGEYWSTTYQPVCKATEQYEAIFTDARAEFRLRDKGIDTHTEIVVSPEDDVELRRINVTNHNQEPKIIELTSYGEVVIASPMSDAQHPAFSNLFVDTELVEKLQAIICSRRPRAHGEESLHMCHFLAAHGVVLDNISYETDRSKFMGRGKNLSAPEVLANKDKELLSNTQGAVLDPIVSIRVRFTLQGGESAILDFACGVSASRAGCIEQIEKFRDKRLADRIFDLSWTHSQVQLNQFNATIYDAQLFEQMASYIIYPNAYMRADASILQSNTRGQSGLWGLSISGDNPIVLLKIANSSNIEHATLLVKAHSYWRLKGLCVDLVIWNEDHQSYRQNLHDLILSVIPSGSEGSLMDKPGGIFVRASQQLSIEDRILLQSAARIVFSDSKGSLYDQVYRRRLAKRLPAVSNFIKMPQLHALPVNSEDDNLILSNSYGGFSPDGKEYVINLEQEQNLPAPWVNVLANGGFGSIVSESGSAYTWKENAHEFRLTPWLNEAVGDSCGEAIYLRDEKSGEFWSPTPLPRRGAGRYTIRHGFGYSCYEHKQGNIETCLTVFVAENDPVKISVLKIKNTSGFSRRLSIAGYVEWVLADLREKSALHVITEIDISSNTLLARNVYNTDFPGRFAFFNMNIKEHTTSGDRAEFLGRNGSMNHPAFMSRSALSGRTGAGLDPCGALHAVFELQDNETREIIFALGASDNREDALAMAQCYLNSQEAGKELNRVQEFWRNTLSVIEVDTPDAGLNVMVNGWLLYQTMASRFLARSGYYQSGGAFGFRDQLQDSMAMVYTRPDLVRNHLLISAGHQFPEGDVMHWWHPPSDRGVRTHISDDYLWLPLVTELYVAVTGDREVLDENVNYIEMGKLNIEDESLYDLPMQSPLSETIYEHCKRAIKRGLNVGIHGLPLIGGGDWNDGMDRVGNKGRGESVWLGFFLYHVMQKFVGIAEGKNDKCFVNLCQNAMINLRESLETNGWDGNWYRRAYFDDNTPLGSVENDECRIDAISQSWAVLSNAAPEWRQQKAMNSLHEELVQKDLGIIKLLAPPFDKSSLEPGYIKGYVPGVRENGGQYTHAAVWAAMAFALLGDRARAWELTNMINPVNHGNSRQAIDIYKIEPYVVAADVYALENQKGRGGWSWYTGAAGWFYRLIVESLLGFSIQTDRLNLNPLLPEDWREVKIIYRAKNSTYHIIVHQQTGEGCGKRIIVDGQEQTEITLADDGQVHQVELYI